MVLSDSEQTQLGIESMESVVVRVIVTIPKVHTEMTANLVAPIVINKKKGLAKQVVLTNAEYDTKHSLMSKKNK
jgi:flagellar assembly factor FliW